MSAPIVAPARPPALTRNRLMAALAAALFGAATSLLQAKKAVAGCPTDPPPFPCDGAPPCPVTAGHCCLECNATNTCGGQHCWTTCASNGRLYSCCDFYHGDCLCICSSCGNCGPGC